MMKRGYLIAALFFAAICGRCLAQNESRFTVQTSQYSDRWVSTLFGSVDLSENVGMNIELDTAGYIALGFSYGYVLKQYYLEAFVNYGRDDFYDVKDVGLFSGRMLTEKWSLYGTLGHQWRTSNSFPILGGTDRFDQTELRSSIGTVYAALSWLDLDMSISHDRILTGNSGIIEVENPNMTYGAIGFTFKPKYVQPFIRFTYGPHRVRPGDAVPTDGSVEVGIRLAF